MKKEKLHVMRNVIITGSSSGIGKALRQYFESRGDQVIGISLSDDDYNCDVSNSAEMKKIFATIAEKHGAIDILIPCAGFGLSGAIELIDSSRVQKEYDVNVMGTINAIQNTLPLMRENGKIINISSACALFPLPFRGYYCSSKAAVSMLSDSLRMELSKTKIQVTAICPCDIKTNFTKNRDKSYTTNERYGEAIRLSAERIDSREDKRMSLEKATKIFIKIIEKKKLKPQYVMGARNKFLYQIQKFFPRSLVLKVMTKMFYRDK
ncbi:MAG: SDR family NAD(P)-dependent oxidoreductase [Clostridia bacterium]|nr:SDR family NAD(P)-dependent oxidoreductase [Clostridia bacterium]